MASSVLALANLQVSYSLRDDIISPKVLISVQECASKCWDNSQYVSTCHEAIGPRCLCQDDEFQNVCIQCTRALFSVAAANPTSRSCSNAFILSVKRVNLARRYIRLFQSAQPLTLTPSMNSLDSYATKVYTGAYTSPLILSLSYHASNWSPRRPRLPLIR